MTLVSICACVLAITIPLAAQDASAAHGILGYLDPKTGTFHLLPALQDAEPPAATTVTGKIVANFTITVDSTFASTAKIGCNISATVLDASTGNVIAEEAGNAVTRGTSDLHRDHTVFVEAGVRQHRQNYAELHRSGPGGSDERRFLSESAHFAVAGQHQRAHERNNHHRNNRGNDSEASVEFS